MSPTATRIFRIRPERRLLAARVLATLVVMVADTALGVAWFDLQSAHPGRVGLTFGSAVCLVLLGLSLILLPRSGEQRRRLRLRILPVAAAAIAAFDLAARLLPADRSADIASARMSVLAVICFWLGAACALCLTSRRRQVARAVRGLAVIGLLIAYVAILSFALRPDALAGNLAYAGMSRPLALCLAALFVAICLIDPRPTWLDAVFGAGQGARTARRLAPFVLAGPLLLALVAAHSTQAGFLSPDLRLMLLTAALTFLAAETLSRTAKAENMAQETLRARYRLVKQILEGLPVAVVAFDRDGREIFANEAARRLADGFDTPAAWLRGAEFRLRGATQPLEERRRPLTRALRGEILDGEVYVVRGPEGDRMSLRIGSSDRIYPYDAPCVLAIVEDGAG